MDSFEMEYQKFIAELKAKKEAERKAKEEAEIKKEEPVVNSNKRIVKEMKSNEETQQTATVEDFFL